MTRISSEAKIFGVGLNKTGTTTLGQCGVILGYSCIGCNKSLLEDVVLRKDLSRIKKIVNEYDLFVDWPWPLIFKELDRFFPGSRFILTVRKDERTWLDSLKRHSMRTHPTGHCRKLAYGYNFPHQREREHMRFYARHNENVRTYFSGRENDFIEICWENGDGFGRLCDFLGKDVPDVPMPHSNKGGAVRANEEWLRLNKLLILSESKSLSSDD